ncbi:MAG: tripartite tricarboxylate transporter substrate binding protein [Hyphomicrobiaceae bacterium]|nr:tripartite tricarboxylate transporter substrate binding protein [Hyphomicrobiaceae bacterium]
MHSALRRTRGRLGALATLALVLSTAAAMAQTDFPSRRIHVVLPYPAGGIVDIVTRIVTEKMSKTWGQPIIIEPKPGANGNPAWDQVSRAEPDGYTWTFLSPATMANPRMQNLRWSEKSFVPAAAAVWAPSVLAVHPSLPASTVKEFIAYAKKNPGVLNFANPGIGTSQHLNTMIMIKATGIEAVGVPYRGQPPGIMDLIANRVQFKVASIGLVAEHIESKALKPLAVLGTSRSPRLPDVPTFTEAGYPEINVVAWYGYGVPAGTPAAVVEKINQGFNEALRDPDVRAALERQALQPVAPMTAAEIAALYASDTEKYAKVIREANIKLGD